MHTQVHSQTSHDLRDVRVAALEAIDNGVFSYLSEEEKTKAKKYIGELPEADNIIHLDFHTDNIMADNDNYQVIDWMTACRGKPEAELAMMIFLFHDAELFPGSSKIKIFLMSSVRVAIYISFIKNYCKINTQYTPESHKPWDLVAWVLRAGIWNIASEKELLERKIKEFISNV